MCLSTRASSGNSSEQVPNKESRNIVCGCLYSSLMGCSCLQNVHNMSNIICPMTNLWKLIESFLLAWITLSHLITCTYVYSLAIPWLMEMEHTIVKFSVNFCHSFFGWDHVTQGLVQLGFTLMDAFGPKSFGMFHKMKTWSWISLNYTKCKQMYKFSLQVIHHLLCHWAAVDKC